MFYVYSMYVMTILLEIYLGNSPSNLTLSVYIWSPCHVFNFRFVKNVCKYGLRVVYGLFAPAFSSLYGKILQSAEILYIHVRYHNITVLYSISLTHYFISVFYNI